MLKREKLRINRFEAVNSVVKGDDDLFEIVTDRGSYQAKYVIIATGYYDHPNYIDIPGEELDKVFHYFKEGHPYFDTDVAVIGGKKLPSMRRLSFIKRARVSLAYIAELIILPV